MPLGASHSVPSKSTQNVLIADVRLPPSIPMSAQYDLPFNKQHDWVAEPAGAADGSSYRCQVEKDLKG
jgi:hypothetical protein